MSLEELPHTADVKIRVRTPDINSLFSEACQAMMQVIYGNDRKDGIQQKIELDAPDQEALLLDFLSEVLFITETEDLVITWADVTVEGSHLAAILHGERFDPRRHSEGTEVKGISYSGMSIKKIDPGYVMEIIFDV